MERFRVIGLLLLFGQAFVAGSDQAFDVLEKNCIECHNSHDKKGDVILDQAPLKLDDLQVIIDAVSGDEPDMPPKRAPLSVEEIAALQQWVNLGAKFPEGRILKDTRLADQDWWSLRPLQNSELPTQSKWARNEIDHFVLAKLSEKGLSPSAEADARTLIRRLTFDLTGLPPTPDEVRKFVIASKESPDDAYIELVDRLLASPRYGEQWARHWLDVARYGETHGYDKDKARFNAWPYRDYVIDSFNEDKPWSRFVQEQVAGDVLWPGKPDGIIALGFIAAGPWDFIAHTEVGEGKVDGRIAKHLDRDDMVSAVFNAFMSTTVQCAQCHNHKFDPVSMQDYYRLQAVFAGVDRADRVYDLDPELTDKRLQLEKKIAAAEREIRLIAKAINKAGGASLKQARQSVDELNKSASYKVVPEHGYHSKISNNQNEIKWVQFELPASRVVRKIRLIGSHDDYAGIGAGFGFPLRYKIEMAADANFSSGVKVVADHTALDYINPGVTPVDFSGGEGKYIRITATKLAERKNDYIFALGEVELIDKIGKNLAMAARITAKDSIEAGSRWGRGNLKDGKYTKDVAPGRSQQLSQARKHLASLLSKIETPDRVRKRKALQKQISEAKKPIAKLPKGKLVYTLATDFKPRSKFKPTAGVMRAIHLLNRGDINSPAEAMKPGAPAFRSGAASEFELAANHVEGDRRAALAHYLTHPDNSLLWRSAVNRIWLGHFGRGIVDSPNDFGRMGMQPSHPELLDWLAIRLRDTESVKGIHRLIVTSSTYRQASVDDPAKSKIDSSNAYYWRMNRRKLRAEEMRDSILSVAGVLDLKMGGPSFHDFKFKDDHTPKYWYHLHDPADPNAHRRTIYRLIARSQTQPFLTTLDCADPSQMVAKRDETTTSLQALALMNNPFVTTMCDKLAERVETDIDEAVWLALSRGLTKDERAIFNRYLKQHGMAALARIIFNLNEFAYVD